MKIVLLIYVVIALFCLFYTLLIWAATSKRRYIRFLKEEVHMSLREMFIPIYHIGIAAVLLAATFKTMREWTGKR